MCVLLRLFCVCVCVCERERERAYGCSVDSFVRFECNRMNVWYPRVCGHVRESVCVCVCVCVFVFVCVCARAVLIIGGFVDRPTRPGVSLEVREREREGRVICVYKKKSFKPDLSFHR